MTPKVNALNGKVGEFVRGGGKPYGIVPFELLECRSLPIHARLVAAWIESKPDGWVVYPSALQKALGISEKLWLSARRAMIAAGIFTHQKFRNADGQWNWKSEFDITPILNPIPPLAAHGEAADIEIRKEEIRDKGLQKTVDHCVAVNSALPANPKPSSGAKMSDLNELKKLHIGFVLNELGIDWDKEGNYIYWNDKSRACKADDGHWLWIEVDGAGETSDSGSAIDVIMSDRGCSQAHAINLLRCIYKEAMKPKA